MKFNFKRLLLITAVVLVPIYSMAEDNPKTECPKKNKAKTDSLSVVEENESTPASEYDLKHNVIQEEFVTNRNQKPTAARESLAQTQLIEEAELIEEHADSPLSFNFVYYIFEKFKFSSSVEP